MTQQLSPDAQAILNAFWKSPNSDDIIKRDKNAVAAVLHAAANRLSFGHATGAGIIDEDELRAIANELQTKN